jgi:hypothetical protein
MRRNQLTRAFDPRFIEDSSPRAYMAFSVAKERTKMTDEEQVENQDGKSPPYNYNFALRAIGAGLIAFVATMIALIAFTTELDAAAVTGALGALFTLIGTISGAYFGIKKSSDTEDKGRAAERAANARAEEANKVTREAVGVMNPTEWENVRERF